MTTSVHSALTGSDLHESKGVATALAGEVYVTDGAGSGVWTPASSVITNSAFSTGDLKPTHKTSADATWILWVDGTIGDGSSSASVRANADTAALFTLYYNGYSNTLCPVSGGRGVSAAADYAAHKTITLPPGAGRVLGVAGSGSGLTTRPLGITTGEETHTLTLTELATGITSAGSMTSAGGSLTFVGSSTGTGITGFSATGGGAELWKAFSNGTNAADHDVVVSGSVTSNNTGGAAHNNLQPTSFVNVMIKL